MLVLIGLGVLAATGLPHLLRRLRNLAASGSDAPERIVVTASRLMTARRDWGLAMAAELPQVRGQARRWQFAAGVLRVALFPPARRPERAVAVAITGLAVTAVLTAAAVAAARPAALFIPLLGLLLSGYAAAVAARPHPAPPGIPYEITAVLALAAVAVSAASLVWIAIRYPPALSDHWRAFSVLLALVIAAHLALALAAPRGRRSVTAAWWTLGGAVACAGIYTAAALVQGPVPALVGSAGVTLAVGYRASAATGSRLAGARAGLVCAVVGALAHFAVDAVVLLTVPRYPLVAPHGVAQYHHSGALDLASYVIGDALAGALLTGLLIYPAVLAGAALVGSAAAGRGAPAERARSC
jgi:hypothetical protein